MRLSLLALILLLAPTLCMAQRYVSYSASTSLSASSGHSFNSAGQACLQEKDWNVRKVNPDGSTAYLTPSFTEGAVIDAAGNCYFWTYSPIAGTQNSTILITKLNILGVPDPTFAPFTLPGSGNSTVTDMAADGEGNVYVVGNTTALDYPLVNAQGGSGPSFVFKLSSDGTHLIYSTRQNDTINAVDVDSSGAAYVAGSYVTKYDPNGTILYATLLNGVAYGIAVDEAGEAYVAGYAGANLPLVNPLPGTAAGTGQNAFLSELKADGSEFLFTSYLGTGSAQIFAAHNVALDGNGNVYVAGIIGSYLGSPPVQGMANIPLVHPLQQTFSRYGENLGDLFVAEISPTGDSILFSSLLGGPGPDALGVMAVDSSGTIYITGSSSDALDISATVEYPYFGDGAEFPMVNADSQPYGNGTLLFNDHGLQFFVRIAPSSGTAFAVPDTIDFTTASFDNVEPIFVVGQTGGIPDPIQISNFGTSDVHISSIDVTGDFTGTNDCPAVLSAGSTVTSCAITLTFAPTAPGNRSGTITIYDDAPGNPHVIDLINAPAIAAAGLAITPSSLSFSGQPVGTTSTTQTISLTDTSPQAGPISLTRISITGDFSEITTCSSTLQRNPCTISVTFTPTATGTRTGTLTITDSDPSSPQTITLTGTGINAQPTLTPSIAGSGTQTITAGQTATYSLSASGFSGTVSFACSGAPLAATCTVNPTALTMPASGSGTVVVSVPTTARSGLLVPSLPHWPPFTRLPLYVIAFLALLSRFRFFARWKLQSRARLALVMCAVVFVVCPIFVGCGGSNNTPPISGTPAGTYTITVTGTVGTVSQSAALTLIAK